MTNPHIELVKKYLADPESISPEELDANAASARTARIACTADIARASEAAAYAAAYWVKRYEELTK